MDAAALLREAAAALEAAGVPASGWDAERLLRHVLGWDRATLHARLDAEIEPADAARFLELVATRARRVPLQQITGTQPFWRHEFLVTSDVLIPRPETELVVETALARLRGIDSPLIVDVGTGSGCIALSLAAERPDASVIATDLSAAALAVARQNARRLGLERRVAFLQGDLLAPVRDQGGRIDLVVSNPPYVPPKDKDALAPEVRDHEPAQALFGSDPPELLYASLAREAAELLRPGGLLIVEIGLGLAPSAAAALRAANLRVEAPLPDLQGIPRVLVAERRRTSPAGDLAPGDPGDLAP